MPHRRGILTTPEEKKYEEDVLIPAYATFRNTIYNKLKHRLAKAKAAGNKQLIAQIESEFEELHFDLEE